jgi:hypothetical protein
MNVRIKTTPYSVTSVYEGVYTEKIQWEDEVEFKSYPFSVVTAKDDKVCPEECVNEITWVDGTPPNLEEVENFIFRTFKKDK